MIKKLLLISVLLSSLVGLGQTPVKNTPINIGVTCGYTGITSEELVLIKKAVNAKDETQLKSLITSPNIKLQLLAILALDHMSRSQAINFTPDQNKLISEFKSKTDKVYICFTCTGHYNESIAQLFSETDSEGRKIIEAYFYTNY